MAEQLGSHQEQLSRFEQRQRDLVCQEVKDILSNLAQPNLSGLRLTEEVSNLRTMQEQGWNPNLFEGLLTNSSHWKELKRNPQNYGRLLNDHETVDSESGIHIIFDADKTKILELTPFALSQLLANQKTGIPYAEILSGADIWAFGDNDVSYILSPMAGCFFSHAGCSFSQVAPGSPPFVSAGSVVTPNTTVCILEYDRVFCDIPSGVSGTILETLVRDSEVVAFGQPLFKYRAIHNADR
jgi:biotin carboxyl carrier protein